MNKELKIEEFYGVHLIEKQIFHDNRGTFNQNFRTDKINVNFNQDNISYSKCGVIRGFHCQFPNSRQSKLITVIQGKIIDVCVDFRKDSKTFGKHFKINLDKNSSNLFIPKDFLHGFLSIEENTIISYKCSDFWSKENEICVNPFDEELSINWNIINIKDLIISEKDENGISFSEFKKKI